MHPLVITKTNCTSFETRRKPSVHLLWNSPKTFSAPPLKLTENLQCTSFETHRKPSVHLLWNSPKTSKCISLRLTENLQVHIFETHRKPPSAYLWDSPKTSKCISLKLTENLQVHIFETHRKPLSAYLWDVPWDDGRSHSSRTTYYSWVRNQTLSWQCVVSFPKRARKIMVRTILINLPLVTGRPFPTRTV